MKFARLALLLLFPAIAAHATDIETPAQFGPVSGTPQVGIDVAEDGKGIVLSTGTVAAVDDAESPDKIAMVTTAGLLESGNTDPAVYLFNAGSLLKVSTALYSTYYDQRNADGIGSFNFLNTGGTDGVQVNVQGIFSIVQPDPVAHAGALNFWTTQDGPLSGTAFIGTADLTDMVIHVNDPIGDSTLTIDNEGGGAANLEVEGTISGANLSSGQYSPTPGNVVNFTGVSAGAFYWSRSGSVVTVLGNIDATPASGAVNSLRIPLPVSSNLDGAGSTANQLNGSALMDTATGAQVGTITASTTGSDDAELRLYSTTGAAAVLRVTFTYFVD